MSNILAYIASAPHEITKAIDLSPRLTMTNGSNGVDNADAFASWLHRQAKRRSTMFTQSSPRTNSVRLSFQRRDCRA